jgi:hypothetical protein
MASASVTPIRKSAKTPTIGSLADAMFDLREKRRVLDDQSKEIAAQIAELELQLIDVLDQQGTTKGDGKKASVSISESIQPNVKNWDEVWKFIIKGKHTQLMQLRISAPAWRELCEMKKSPPGIEAFTKRSVNLTVKK